MNVLVLSTVFPNERQPQFGGFVRERMRRVARDCALEVVAPTPWFPMNAYIRGRRWKGLPAVEEQAELTVHHPRIVSFPKFCKPLDGVLYAASLLPFVVRLRRRFPFDLIDAHFAYPDGVAAVILGRLLRCPVVITLRGSIVRLARYRLHRPQIRAALRGASRVLSVSESLKRVAVEIGVPAEHIRVIPNGVDAERFRPRDGQEARRTLGLPPDRTILLSIGGLNEGKGFHRLIGVLPGVRARHPGTLLVIVGGERPGDNCRAMLERRVNTAGLHAAVIFAGERPHDEIPCWLAACDLFCLATRSEGWSNVLLEALACGRPVVATRVGGNPEIVPDERYGVLVAPESEDALAAGIEAALARQWDSVALSQYAHQHSWDAAAAQVLEEFYAAMQRHGSAPFNRPTLPGVTAGDRR